MLHRIFASVALVMAAFLFSACQEQATAPASSEQDLLIQKTQIMTDSRVQILSVQRISDNGDHWEVKIDMPGDGGIVKFEYFIGTSDLKQIKGLTPSFDYSIEPGLGFVNYSTAKSAALGAVSGEIVEWKLEKDVSDNQWQYRFEILFSGDDYEVRLDALTGTVIRVKN